MSSDDFKGVMEEALKGHPDISKIQDALAIRKALTERMTAFKDKAITKFRENNPGEVLNAIHLAELERTINGFYTSRVTVWLSKVCDEIDIDADRIMDHMMKSIPDPLLEILDVEMADGDLRSCMAQQHTKLRCSNKVRDEAVREWIDINIKISRAMGEEIAKMKLMARKARRKKK